MERATQRIEKKVPAHPETDDEWVETAITLQTGCLQEGALARDVHIAQKIWKTDNSTRRLLDAYLLTNESFNDVAKACSLSESEVQAYHELFFDVRPKLAARDWIATQVIRRSLLNNPVENRSLLKPDLMLFFGHGTEA
jgi:hypothetical protein